MMRILLDECGFDWDKAFEICQKVFAYTNHTVMAEALEKWNVDIFKMTLPRIYQIVVEMNAVPARSWRRHSPAMRARSTTWP